VTASTCGCCAGVEGRTPGAVYNRPGLSTIDYRIGRQADFLASMVAGLTDADRPRLASLTTRDPDDLSIAMLDAWAVAADVLTFYTERLANESYLRTASERISLQELGRLIGYRLRPGVAAETHLAFAIEPPPAVPAAASRDPGSNPRVTPATVALEAGLRVQSIPAPGEQPQTFETIEAIEARPEWNTFAASTTVPAVGIGLDHAHLVGADLNLKPGDAFLLVGHDGAAGSNYLRILASVTTHLDTGRTDVTWSPPLPVLDPFIDPSKPAGAFVMRKRLDVFGHSAPMWLSMSEEFRTKGYPGGDKDDAEWPDFSISPTETAVDVEGSHADIATGSWVVLSNGTSQELWKVEGLSELSRAEFAVSGKVTRLTLSEGENYDDFQLFPRETTVFAVSQPLTIADAPDGSDVTDDVITVDLDVSAMRPGRRLIVRGTTTAGEPHVESVELREVKPVPGGWQIALSKDLATAYRRDSVAVHGNVALATHGETVQQLLGSGQAAAAFQRFTLAHAPLTYLQSSDPSGASAALEVRVNEVRWDEVPTLYGTAPTARDYTVRDDAQGRTYVQFGDGGSGARLPSGSHNVRARYRKGIGAAGNVKPDALAQLLDRPLGVKGVSNPVAATGGVDREAETSARASMPLAVRTLGRAVSLLDYEDYARAFTGVVKADAAVLNLRGGLTIVVTVALTGVPETATADRLEDLGDSLRSHGDPLVQLVVLPGSIDTFRLALKVAVDPAYETKVVLAAVEAALRSAFAFEARALGEPVHRSGVIAMVHGVPGVVAVDIDLLYAGAIPDLVDRLLAKQATVGAGGTAIAAGLLVLDPAPFDTLEAMP